MFNKKRYKFLFLIGLIAIFVLVGQILKVDEEWARSLFNNIPIGVSSVVYVVAYVVITSLIWLGPKDVLRIAAALVYGPYLSTLLVWISELISAIIFFNLSRKLGREFVEGKLKGGMDKLDHAIAQTGVWWIFILRMFLFPFRIMDLGFGLTHISFKKYFIIIFFASPLRLFLFQYLLSLGKEVYKDPQRLAEHVSANPFIFWLCLGYCIGAVVVIFLLRKVSSKRTNSQS